MMINGLRPLVHQNPGSYDFREIRGVLVPGSLGSTEVMVVPSEVANTTGITAASERRGAPEVVRSSLSLAQILRAYIITRAVAELGDGDGSQPHIIYMPSDNLGEKANSGFGATKKATQRLAENALTMLDAAGKELKADFDEIILFGASQGSATSQAIAPKLTAGGICKNPALALMETPNTVDVNKWIDLIDSALKGRASKLTEYTSELLSFIGMVKRFAGCGGPLNDVIRDNFIRAGLDPDGGDVDASELFDSLGTNLPHSALWLSSMLIPSNLSTIYEMAQGGATDNIKKILDGGGRVAMWAGARGVSPQDVTIKLYEQLEKDSEGADRENFAGFLTPAVKKSDHKRYMATHGEGGKLNGARHSGAHNWPRAVELTLLALKIK